ncbi:MAG: D-tyrosyl-tRNA(Tyr) deacylase [Acidobacteria bacterium RIFCSPLOWO2_02_FULL_67_36]|nr:MAG: D-tyrosyl-tRNA(Tyr) deacylase [Acidobacteria bacterium RIFCSPLOWO2_02_FULL_67_36]OFW19335.1 MAG: D-tyrosyl-tRNA(Tyr) deacylase [Acidobacteria bacterium RIFCSPLOWO2_12_FULL_66_21]
MRAVLQRVSRARVTVEGAAAGEIGRGLLALVGVANEDGPADVQYIASKIREIRLFEDENGRMNRSVVETGGAVLVVSQFTLQADCRKGRRPSLDGAAPPALARALYEDVVRALGDAGVRIATGVFQAHMQVELVNDGPVTVLLDSTRAL